MKIYGSLELTLSSPPQTFEEPFEVNDVLKFLKQPQDSDEIELIEAWIAAARETAELLQNRDLVVKQWDLNLDAFLGVDCDRSIELRRPLQSVDLVQYRDSTGATTDLVEDTDYIVDTARGLITPAYSTSWPSFTAHPSSAVLIRFTSGYPSDHPFWLSTGQRIKAGMQMLITRWYQLRLTFVPSQQAIQEIPFGITDLLSWGANPRVR